MNILLYVMTMLMLLALMTYGRLESYRGFAFVQAQFKDYMEKTERSYVTKEARKRYNEERGSTTGKKNNNETNAASSKLSFNLFIDKEERLKAPDQLESHMNAAKNLMYFLYGDQPFFIEVEENRPDFLNEIFASLIRVTDEYTKKEKLNTRKVKEIATIDLGDSELNEVFTKMLKGAIEKSGNGKINRETKSVIDPTKRFRAERGYFSLLDFITIEKNKLKIRVFLASPQLLMALYGNPDTVQQILVTRYELFLRLKNNEISSEVGKEDFQRQFQNLQLSPIPSEMLDFGISKTNPNNYL